MTSGSGWNGGMGQEQIYQTASQELSVGSFMGRQIEQARFREILMAMVTPTGKGFLGGLFNQPPRKLKNAREYGIKSRLFVVSGPAGSGKTTLTFRLAEIVLQDKEIAPRFRVLRLTWNELFERDNRLTARLSGEPPSPEVLLDLIHNHCLREGGEPYFEKYLAAIEDTRSLAKTVKGEELEAVWRYRAQALGQGLQEWSYDTPLLFFFDDLELTGETASLIYPAIFEETGSQCFGVLSGTEVPTGLAENTRPERFAAFRLEPFSPAEFKLLVEKDLQHYRSSLSSTQVATATKLLPALVNKLLETSQGFPLAGRLATYLMQSGLAIDDLQTAVGDGEIFTRLVEILLNEPLSKNHPDRLKLYAFALLRRPEPGLLAALLDLRQDMLDFDETLARFNQRYIFLFEPGRPMTFHTALLPGFRKWLAQPALRSELAGLVKVNHHGLDYLETRLTDWGASFPGLLERLADLKWREWALDKMWHSFWLSEDEGWPVALSLLVAGLGLRPAFTRQVVALLENISAVGLLDEKGQQRLQQFREIALQPSAENKTIFRSFRMMGIDGNYFEKGLHQFTAELAGIIGRFLEV